MAGFVKPYGHRQLPNKRHKLCHPPGSLRSGCHLACHASLLSVTAVPVSAAPCSTALHTVRQPPTALCFCGPAAHRQTIPALRLPITKGRPQGPLFTASQPSRPFSGRLPVGPAPPFRMAAPDPNSLIEAATFSPALRQARVHAPGGSCWIWEY